MNKALWSAQIFLALFYLGFVGGRYLIPVESDMDPTIRAVISILEVAGAIGLILPPITRILPILTPLAASGLALTMIGAIIYNISIDRFSHLPINIFLFIVAAFIAYGRFVTIPFDRPKYQQNITTFS